jgi:dihydrofolate synthase / folylpolyglutamate synthase
MPSARSSPATAASSMPSPVDWIESLSPWPEEFGLGRMHALLAELGEPQRSFDAIHVVGTNGKSTATRRAAAFLAREGLRVGAYTSPHVAGWSERIRVDGDDADFDTAVERVRAAAERAGATQFETLTAAALAEFAAVGVDVAVVEAGLGGRLDATNVLGARIVVLTNVALEHTEVLGQTREAIAREKLAVVVSGATAVLGEGEWAGLARERGAGVVLVSDDPARSAAEQYLRRPLDGDVAIDLPGRFDISEGLVVAGAHNPAGVEWLVQRLPGPDYVICAAMLADKDIHSMLRTLRTLGGRFVATEAETDRSLAADQLAEAAREFFVHVESEPDAEAALSLGLTATSSSQARSIYFATSSADWNPYDDKARRAAERLRGRPDRDRDGRGSRVRRRLSRREAPSLTGA